MGTVAISFFVLFGSSYGISSVLLKKNIKIHDSIYNASQTTTGIYPPVKRTLSVKGSSIKEDWFV